MTSLGPFEHLRAEVTDGLAHLIIARPAVRNALDIDALLDFSRAFRQLGANEELEVVIVSGEGGEAFSSGIDLSDYESDTGTERSSHDTRVQLTFDIAQQARSLPVPVIAKIQGYCLGAGLVLAMYCDLRVAAEDAKFGIPTVRFGQIPTGGATFRLVELSGEAGAKELILGGHHVSADRAYELGFVTDVSAPDRLGEAVDTWVDRLRQGDRTALRASIESINATSDEIDRSAAFEAELERWWDQYTSEDRGGTGDVPEKL